MATYDREKRDAADAASDRNDRGIMMNQRVNGGGNIKDGKQDQEKSREARPDQRVGHFEMEEVENGFGPYNRGKRANDICRDAKPHQSFKPLHGGSGAG